MLRLILQLGIAHGELAAHRRHALATLLHKLQQIQLRRNLAAMVHIALQITGSDRQMPGDIHARSGDNSQKDIVQPALCQRIRHNRARNNHALQLRRQLRLQHSVQRRQHAAQNIIMRRRPLRLRSNLALLQNNRIGKRTAYIYTQKHCHPSFGSRSSPAKKSRSR